MFEANIVFFAIFCRCMFPKNKQRRTFHDETVMWLNKHSFQSSGPDIFDEIRGHEEGMYKTSQIVGYTTYQLVQDFFHQQYLHQIMIYDCIIIQNYNISLTIKPFLKVSKKRPWSKDSKRWKLSVKQTAVDGPCYLSSCIQLGKLHHRTETSCKKSKHLTGVLPIWVGLFLVRHHLYSITSHVLNYLSRNLCLPTYLMKDVTFWWDDIILKLQEIFLDIHGLFVG